MTELDTRWIGVDTHSGSRRADVSIVQDKTAGATTRLARLRKKLDQADKDLAALFARMDENRQELAEQGLVAQHALSPMLEAAYRAYLRGETDQPMPKVFTEIPDPPLMRLEGE